MHKNESHAHETDTGKDVWIDTDVSRHDASPAKQKSAYIRNIERLIERIQSVCNPSDPSDYELKEVYDLASLGCGRVEICRVMGYDYHAAWKNSQLLRAFELGEVSVQHRLRRACMTHAMRGNTQILLFMARNYLPDLVQDPNKPSQHLHIHGPEAGRVPLDLDAIKKELGRLGLPPPAGDDILELDAPAHDPAEAHAERVDRCNRVVAAQSEAIQARRPRGRPRKVPVAPPPVSRAEQSDDNPLELLDRMLDSVDGKDRMWEVPEKEGER